MKYALSLLILLLVSPAFAQSDTVAVNINIRTVTETLLKSPHEINVGVGQSSKSAELIYLPVATGELKAFKLIQYDILPIELRKDIKTYYGQLVDDPSVGCRLTLANGKISASIETGAGNFIIQKNKSVASPDAYLVFGADNTAADCEVQEVVDQKELPAAKNAVFFNSHGTQLRTYRLALLVSSTFYTAGGGTDASVNAYIATIMNSINGLYEKEFAVRFTLASPNNPTSSNVFYVYDGSSTVSAIHNENVNRYGTENFDVGQYLLPGGGGQAFLGVVCNSRYKGGGRSGVSPSYLTTLAHELGHQFSGDHTFNGNDSGSCSPTNRGNNSAYEPGSGNTILSYGGSCSPSIYNITGGRLLYFHTHSQTSVINHITTRPVGCGVITPTDNAVPVVDTPPAFTIPKNTPFTLTALATDANSDPLIYTWEQYDLAPIADIGRLGNTANASGVSAVNSTTAPLFRTLQKTDGSRTFPALTYILNNANNPPDNIGEDLPNVARTLNFRVTVRDNKAGGGGIAFKSVALTVTDDGPFELLTGNDPTLWVQGQTAEIRWAVNGTNVAPINCVQVKISTSVDGGNTFTTLAASTPNDGSHSFTIPNVITTKYRVKIEAIGNVFFDINDRDMVISASCNPEVSNISPADPISQPEGSIDLSQLSYGNQINTLSGTISNVDPAGRLVYSNAGTCAFSTATPRYEVAPYMVLADQNLTFTFSGGTLATNNTLTMYSQPYNNSTPCANYIAAGRYGCGTSICNNGTVTGPNTAGLNYLLISGFANNNSGTYNVTVTGGAIYERVPAAGSLYDYTYLIYDLISGQVVDFQDQPDVTMFTSGSYRLYGLSFQGGFNLTPYVNTSFTDFQTKLTNGTICGKLSTNFRNITLTGPCPNSLNLVSPDDDIASGTVKKEVSGILTAANKITGGNVKYDAGKAIELNPGFVVNNGVVFSAYIDGCGEQ